MEPEKIVIENSPIIAMPEIPKTKDSPWDLLVFALFAIAIVLPIRIFIAQPFVVSGASMSPTFHDTDYLIIDEISYAIKDPARYEVIVFKYPNDKKKYYIKRIIGLPNETVDVKAGIVTITNKENPTGFTLPQPYVKNESNDSSHFQLKDKEYFVMGDNRSGSSDSRSWGALPEDLIVGRVFSRLLPVKSLDLFPGYFK